MLRLLKILDNAVTEGEDIKARCPHCTQVRLVVEKPDRDEYPTFWCHGHEGWTQSFRGALLRQGVPQAMLRPATGATPPSLDEPTVTGTSAAPLPSILTLLETAPSALLNDGRFMGWVHTELGIGRRQVERFGLGLLSYFNRDYLSLPVYDRNGVLVQVRLVNPFEPDRKRRKKWWQGYGARHLFGVELLEGVPLDEPIVWCEGETDYLVLRALGVRAVGAPGAGILPADLSAFAGRPVAVCYDNDDSGRRGADKAARALVAAGAHVWVLDISTKVAEDGADLRDWVIKHGATGLDVEEWVAKAMTSDPLVPDVDGTLAAAEKRFQSLLENELAYTLLRQHKVEQMNARSSRPRKLSGAAFVLDAPSAAEVLWGDDEVSICASGETTLIVGSDGLGKSTLAQQYMGHRLGLFPVAQPESSVLVKDDGLTRFLGYPVAPLAPEKSVLYLAMDRPDQIARSMARMFGSEAADVLGERLHIWRGPLPIDILSSPHALADWVHSEYGPDVGEVFVDSVKDLATKLSDDGVGQGVNLALQGLLASGMSIIGLHHPRKPQERGAEPGLEDVFGSRLLFAGVGSVLMLLGNAGADVVEVSHVKQIKGRLPRLLLQHDHASGRSRRMAEEVSPETALITAEGAGLTKYEAALAVYGTDDDRAAKKVERQLNALVKRGAADSRPGKRGGEGGSTPARWWGKGLMPGVQ